MTIPYVNFKRRKSNDTQLGSSVSRKSNSDIAWFRVDVLEEVRREETGSPDVVAGYSRGVQGNVDLCGGYDTTVREVFDLDVAEGVCRCLGSVVFGGVRDDEGEYDDVDGEDKENSNCDDAPPVPLWSVWRALL